MIRPISDSEYIDWAGSDTEDDLTDEERDLDNGHVYHVDSGVPRDGCPSCAYELSMRPKVARR